MEGCRPLAALLVAIAAGFFFYSRRSQALTEKDSILLADFVNTTGDSVFDGSLKQALAVQLEQSPYLNVLPQSRIQEGAALHGTVSRRAPDQRCGAGDLRSRGRQGDADRFDFRLGQPLRD